MPFRFIVGDDPQNQDFSASMMPLLALKGMEITEYEATGLLSAIIHVKHTSGQGKMESGIENDNARITYTFGLERKEISKGVMGAITGTPFSDAEPDNPDKYQEKNRIVFNSEGWI